MKLNRHEGVIVEAQCMVCGERKPALRLDDVTLCAKPQLRSCGELRLASLESRDRSYVHIYKSPDLLQWEFVCLAIPL